MVDSIRCFLSCCFSVPSALLAVVQRFPFVRPSWPCSTEFSVVGFVWVGSHQLVWQSEFCNVGLPTLVCNVLSFLVLCFCHCHVSVFICVVIVCECVCRFLKFECDVVFHLILCCKLLSGSCACFLVLFFCYCPRSSTGCCVALDLLFVLLSNWVSVTVVCFCLCL